MQNGGRAFSLGSARGQENGFTGLEPAAQFLRRESLLESLLIYKPSRLGPTLGFRPGHLFKGVPVVAAHLT